jgi:hypothetical protein
MSRLRSEEDLAGGPTVEWIWGGGKRIEIGALKRAVS